MGPGQTEQQGTLQQTVEELRRRDESRNTFVTIASHELRSPIAAIYGIATTLSLRAPYLGEGQVRTLHDELLQQSSRLRRLADQLLDLSRIHAGVRTAGRERFHAKDRLDVVLSRVACGRDADVLVAVDPELEIELDPLAFDGIVSNLLDNALRYGEPPVEVRVAGSAPLRVVVEDHGEGVEPAFVPRLFESFTRSTSAGRVRPEGAGLGLAIAEELARGLGGRLGYEPCDPHGARFTFELPR